MTALELRKRQAGNETGHDKTPKTTVPVRPKSNLVRPVREINFGRRLAFTIDEDSIQMATASHWGPRVRLIDISKSYLSPDDRSGDGRWSFLRRTIKDYVRQFGGRRPSISLTLTGPQTALRTVTMPRLKGAELQTALMFEAKRQVPFPDDDCWIDYRVTEELTRGDERHLKASILAATKVAVGDLLAPFEELGLEVTHLYHTQDVIGQLLRPLPDFDKNRPYTLIDIHRRSTEISYFRGSNLEFYHVSSLGSSFLANRSDPTVFEYFAESLATEIQNSLDFYGGQYSTDRIRETYIYGDLSYTDELISLLSDRFGFRFCRFPIKHLPIARSRSGLVEDNIAVCLPAVAAASNQNRIANLLPEASKRKRRRQRVDRIGLAALMVLAGSFGAHWFAATTSLQTAQEHFAELDRRGAEFRASEMYATYNHLKRKLAANQAFIDQTRDKPSYLSLNLKELTHLMPKSVRLYDLEFNAKSPEQNLLISGLIASKDSPPELVLAELVENLTASPFYENVTLERHVKKREPDGFVLNFNLSMTGVI